MKRPQRVVWSEGMLMSPQHLQQLDLYHEGLLSSRVDAVAPWSWGVLSLDLSDPALAAGQIQLQEFSGILPSGVPLSFEAGQPEAPSGRPIGAHFGPTLKQLEVFVGVPREREGVANVSEKGDGQGMRTRYAPVTRQVVDATGAVSDISVAFAQCNVALLFGNEAREDYEVIKVAEVLRDKTGAFLVRDSYIPSCTRIGASPFLMSGLRRLLASLVTKRRELVDATRQRDASSVEFGASDVTKFLLLNAVNSFLPALKHMSETPEMPPHLAYLLLSEFAGQMCTFTVDADPTTLPAFVFTDLGGTFEALFARVTALVLQRVRQDYISVTLEARDDGVHSAKLDDERLVNCREYVLAARADMAEHLVVDQLPKLSKIASWGDISDLVASATPGVPLKATSRPPIEIPIRAGVVYFTLSTKDHYFKNILSERTMAVYLPPPFDPSKTKLELMAVPTVSVSGGTGQPVR